MMRGLFLSLSILHRTLLVVLFFGGVVWIVDQHIPFAGVRTIEYTSGVPNGSVTRPHPLDRIEDISDGRGGVVEKLREEPVYFEVKTSANYEQATIRVRFQNNATVPMQLGVKLGDTNGAVRLVPIRSEKAEGEWTVGDATFDLKDIPRVNGRYSFLFSIPGVQHEHPERGSVSLSRMTIKLDRRPATASEYLDPIRRMIRL
ncbi:MAG: hypothetical protein Q7S47_02305 [bacterium]|nr:hypothetical protein [bacterium]